MIVGAKERKVRMQLTIEKLRHLAEIVSIGLGVHTSC